MPLPDPLVCNDDVPVQDAFTWQNTRRAELLELFRSQVYGRVPVDRPGPLSFHTLDITPGLMEGAAVRKQVLISYRGPGGTGTINLLMFLPAHSVNQGKPVPAFVLICNRDAANLDPERTRRSPFWPAEAMVARGYAAVAFLNTDVAPDNSECFKRGVHAIYDLLCPEGTRPDDGWGAIAAWAWGASRVMDYLETDPHIDAARVAVVGHSRGGKAALWAGAEDERFALVVSNDSGCTGAAISRGKRGESIRKINATFPYWFCPNYHRYAGREEELPVDQHELIALIAPRLVYVASASEDEWADPDAEYRACVAASPVYALLGKRGVEEPVMPPSEVPLHAGTIGYHLRTGEHDLTPYDWEQFLDFADRHRL